MDSLVSIIVPIYMVEECLDKCIDSIVNQSYRNLEIILIDDGSPDLCPEICANWEMRDSRIKVIHKTNAGLSHARNDGLDIARGDYITFVDSDDYISENAIEVLVRRIEKDHSDLVVARFAMVYSDGKPNEHAFSWIQDKVIPRNAAIQMIGDAKSLPVYSWGKLYRRELFADVRFKPLACAEDVMILPEIMERCNQISLMEDEIYFYYQRATSIVHSKTAVHICDSITASLRMAHYLFDKGFVEGACRYYYSALCQSYELDNRNEMNEIIRHSFSNCDKRRMQKMMDMNMLKSLLAAKYPSIYRLFRSNKR